MVGCVKRLDNTAYTLHEGRRHRQEAIPRVFESDGMQVVEFYHRFLGRVTM